MRIELDCAVIIFFCFIQFRSAHVEHGKINVHFRVIGIDLQGSVVFLLGLLEPAVLLERGAVIKLRPCTGWQIRSHMSGAIGSGGGAIDFAIRHRTERKHKHHRPLRSVQCPSRQKSAQAHIRGAAFESERLSRRFFANFPDKTVVIKMQKSRRCHDTREHARDGVHSNVGIQIADRAISHDQPDIESDQRSAPAKDETHESADGTVFLHPVPIVDPNNRKVLRVVKNLEERDAGQNIRDAVIAIPPKRDAAGKQRQLHRILARPGHPHSNVISQPKQGHGHGRDQQTSLQKVNPDRRNKGKPAPIQSFERIRHPRR